MRNEEDDRDSDLSSFYESAFPGGSSSGPSIGLASSGLEERGGDYPAYTDAPSLPPRIEEDDRDSDQSSFYVSVFPGESSSGPSIGLVHLASSEDGDDYYDYPAETDAPGLPPPLGVKLTVYRLLNVTVLFSFGIAKSILAYKGKSTAPTTLDWVGGTLLLAVLYWIGLYEDTKKWEWFFHIDLAPAVGYCTKCVVGGFLFLLFLEDGVFVAMLLGMSIAVPVADWLANHSNWWPYSMEDLTLSAFLGGWSLLLLFLGTSLSLAGLVAGVGALTRGVRARLRAWQRVMRFVDEYGPGGPLVEGYERIGKVGTTVGAYGCAVFFSPFVVLPVFYLIL